MPTTAELSDALLRWTKVLMRGQMTGFVSYARRSGLSMSQAGALFRLHGHGRAHGVSDIGDHLGVTSAAASQLLDRLVQQGLILRSEDPEDRRAKRVSLTEKGQSIIENAMKGRQRWFESLAETMTEKERATVLSGLEILIRKVEESVSEEDFDFQEEESSQK